jgi:hypothetical protein
MQIFEYSLNLCTGETIRVSEISMGALDKFEKSAFEDPATFEAMSSIISLCTKAPHQAMEDAKIGHTKPLEKLLRTPPVGTLMKVDRPVCTNMFDCAMADSKKCTTRFSKFPECWDYAMDGDGDLTNSMVAAHEIVKEIVMAWRDGRYVIISE